METNMAKNSKHTPRTGKASSHKDCWNSKISWDERNTVRGLKLGKTYRKK
ncbi:MAG: hypothetical protein ACTSR3_20140 [Candidatus Helarchaeota archaeon]